VIPTVRRRIVIAIGGRLRLFRVRFTTFGYPVPRRIGVVDGIVVRMLALDNGARRRAVAAGRIWEHTVHVVE
jgi:hypothetical protein